MVIQILVSQHTYETRPHFQRILDHVTVKHILLALREHPRNFGHARDQIHYTNSETRLTKGLEDRDKKTLIVSKIKKMYEHHTYDQ